MHTVAPIVPVDGLYSTAVDRDALEKAAREAAQVELDRLARAARKARVRVATVLRRGYAADDPVCPGSPGLFT
jgi:hypothetical protein